MCRQSLDTNIARPTNYAAQAANAQEYRRRFKGIPGGSESKPTAFGGEDGEECAGRGRVGGVTEACSGGNPNFLLSTPARRAATRTFTTIRPCPRGVSNSIVASCCQLWRLRLSRNRCFCHLHRPRRAVTRTFNTMRLCYIDVLWRQLSVQEKIGAGRHKRDIKKQPKDAKEELKEAGEATARILAGEVLSNLAL
ncbi:7781_t:CDS:1 [Paraglomus brasilianum]|uniref:7781_t:CDS:1 n=1 Tax=Paraglomus brasilianum TaxID=144538 RepID=A0A9N8ZZB6_9GLOM|nr:7781_t:CDS:1 [Paraglomus brasilianum]